MGRVPDKWVSDCDQCTEGSERAEEEENRRLFEDTGSQLVIERFIHGAKHQNLDPRAVER